jgi:hypothetical protein
MVACVRSGAFFRSDDLIAQCSRKNAPGASCGVYYARTYGNGVQTRQRKTPPPWNDRWRGFRLVPLGRGLFSPASDLERDAVGDDANCYRHRHDEHNATHRRPSELKNPGRSVALYSAIRWVALMCMARARRPGSRMRQSHLGCGRRAFKTALAGNTRGGHDMLRRRGREP